jgi:hypothetical protein
MRFIYVKAGPFSKQSVFIQGQKIDEIHTTKPGLKIHQARSRMRKAMMGELHLNAMKNLPDALMGGQHVGLRRARINHEP